LISQLEDTFKDYDFWHRELPKYGSIATIAEEIAPGERVLDVGCSDGCLARYLPENEVWGLDVNPRAVERARQFCKNAEVFDLNLLDSQPLPFESEFDVIVCADVLEHLLWPEKVLRHLAGTLRNGGRAVISLPNIALWRVRLKLLFGLFDYTEYGVLDSTHLHFYTFKTAKELVECCGFRVLKMKGSNTYTILGFFARYMPCLKRLFSVNIITVAVKSSVQT
jgi:methionine biosynthesis protein MetW